MTLLFVDNLEILDAFMSFIAIAVVAINFLIIGRKIQGRKRRNRREYLAYSGLSLFLLFSIIQLFTPESAEAYMRFRIISGSLLISASSIMLLFTIFFAHENYPNPLHSYSHIFFPFILIFALLAAVSGYSRAFIAVSSTIGWLIFYVVLFQLGNILKTLKIRTYWLLYLSCAIGFFLLLTIDLVLDSALSLGYMTFEGYMSSELWTVDFILAYASEIIAIIPGIIALTDFVSSGRRDRVLNPLFTTSILQYVDSMSHIMGSSANIVLKSAIKDFNTKFSKNIESDSGIDLTGVKKEEREYFIKKLIFSYYECIGKIAISEAKNTGFIDEIARELEEKLFSKNTPVVRQK